MAFNVGSGMRGVKGTNLESPFYAAYVKLSDLVVEVWNPIRGLTHDPCGD